MAFTPQNVSSAVTLRQVALSPDGSKVVYCVSELKAGGESQKSSLWYASDLFGTDDKVESIQITSGKFNDRQPQWHPDSKSIYFLSDRVENPGAGAGITQLYKIPVTGPSEPSILHSSFKGKKQGTEGFKISPDGKYIAFTSADESSVEAQKKKDDKDDSEVWGDIKSNAHLRVFTISICETKTLVGAGHVFNFVWSPDSKSLLYCLATHSSLEAQYEPTTLATISILPGSTPVLLQEFQTAPPDDILWPFSHSEIYFQGSYHSEYMVDASVIKRLSISGSAAQKEIRIFYTGETEDAKGFINVGNGEMAIRVASGLSTRIDLLNRDGKPFVLYDTKDIESLVAFDVKEVDKTYVFACIRSSGPRKEPPTVFVGRAKKDKKLDLKSISSHYPWVSSHTVGAIERFDWTGEDGTRLDGVAWFPQGLNSSNVTTPLPTVVYVHGGPYFREEPGFNPSIFFWANMLAENGFLVISPNYRGSSGRGSSFARAAYHGVGTIEWSDIDRMINEAVKRGLADQSKLGIGGWSQGGFLSAWAASLTKSKFKCAVMGAGVSDWGTLCMETDLPHFEEQLSAASPWLGSKARQIGDPIRSANGVETAFLIVHGQNDARIPVAQATGFYRALRRMSKYPERHVLVIYPREPHAFVEQKHGEDLLKRVLGHFETWLK